MATTRKTITVKATPGKNTPVDHVIRLEDLLERMRHGAPKPARGRAAAPAEAAGELTALQQLAAELEARMRAQRGATSPAPAPAKRTRGSRKKS